MRVRPRHLFPPSGQQYELFDNSAFVVAIVGLRYVVEGASTTQEEGLAVLGQVASLELWGSVLTLAAVFSLICSYRKAWIRAGYSVLIAGLTLWCVAFLVGIGFYGASPVTVVSALIYAKVIRHLVVEAVGRRRPTVENRR